MCCLDKATLRFSFFVLYKGWEDSLIGDKLLSHFWILQDFFILQDDRKMTQDELIKDFGYERVVENIIGEFNRITNSTIENDIEFYADKEVFYTDEEKEEIKEVIRQKVALMVTDELINFILLKR